jgi:S-adenosylmethionine:tRNA ribosyltransferase-isomerase
VSPAAWPRDDPGRERLLEVDPRSGALRDRCVGDLPSLLQPGDLLVVNDAATLPASLAGRTGGGDAIEVRLAGENDDGTWAAVLFGPGDWRTPTERREPPPLLAPGDQLSFGGREARLLGARIVRVDERSPRLVTLRFDARGDRLWTLLYRLGRPVQYSYVRQPLPLWHVQSTFAARPWAVELPSAGRPLTPTLLLALRRRGVEVARVTHAAGLSSTGDPQLDRALPLPERYEIPAETVAAVRRARGAGQRVVAVGTTVVRALEGNGRDRGQLVAGVGRTSLRVDRRYRPRVVDGLLSGVHAPGESHFELLTAFAPEPLLRRAVTHAEAAGYLAHEFGDSMLVLAARERRPAPAR